jgi:hypothetical protein
MGRKPSTTGGVTLKVRKILLTLIACAVISSAKPVMTNRTVEAMLRGGVPVPTILSAIKTAEYIQLFMSTEFYDRLLNAGASPSVADQIVQAMHDRTYKGAVRPEDVKPVPVAVALARPPVVPTGIAQPVETNAPVETPTPSVVVPAPDLIAPVHQTMTIEDGTSVRLRISHDLSSADAIANGTFDFDGPWEVEVGKLIAILKASMPQSVQPGVSTPEPELEDIFFGLSGTNLVPLERQAVGNPVDAAGFLVVNGKRAVPGAASPVRFQAGELAFVVRSLSGTTAADPSDLYHLRKLTPKKDRREAIMSTVHASPLGASASNTRSDGVLPVRFSRYGASSYKVTVDALTPGEYALGRTGDNTVFCFGVD